MTNKKHSPAQEFRLHLKASGLSVKDASKLLKLSESVIYRILNRAGHDDGNLRAPQSRMVPKPSTVLLARALLGDGNGESEVIRAARKLRKQMQDGSEVIDIRPMSKALDDYDA